MHITNTSAAQSAPAALEPAAEPRKALGNESNNCNLLFYVILSMITFFSPKRKNKVTYSTKIYIYLGSI